MSTTATIPQFQNYVWGSLPIRKEAIDREFVDDLVLVAVQQWPSDELSASSPGSEEEADAVRRLQWDIRRVLEFTYGQDRFSGYWILGARVVIPQAVDVMLKWWRRRKDNRAKILIWRRRWVI